MQYLWLGLLVITGIAEAFWAKRRLLGFMPAFLAAMILAFLHATLTVQLVTLVALSVVGFVVCRLVFGKKGGKKSGEGFLVEDLIGEKCRVVEKIDNVACRGAVTVQGMEWAARTLSDEEVLEEGDAVVVIAVEGVKVICKKI
jgi:membrane protein implicated in regulation of membrane protease activity